MLMLWKRGIFVVLEPENLTCEVILAVPIDEAEKLAKQIKEGQLLGQNYASVDLTACPPQFRKSKKIPSVERDKHAAVASRIRELILI